MPKEKFITPEINLLPGDALENKPGGRFLNWALSWGKKIVILTELLVILAFLSRFKFDSDVATNSEDIDRLKIIIQSSAGFENQFRAVQNRLEKAKAISVLNSPVTIYDKTKQLIPDTITITQITVSGSKLSLQGKGEDRLLSLMVASFKSSPDFSDVTLDKVTKQAGGDNLVDFSLTANYLPKST